MMMITMMTMRAINGDNEGDVRPREHQQHLPLSPSSPQRLPPAKVQHQDQCNGHNCNHDHDLEEGKVGMTNVVESDLGVHPGVVLISTLPPSH